MKQNAQNGTYITIKILKNNNKNNITNNSTSYNNKNTQFKKFNRNTQNINRIYNDTKQNQNN